MNILRWSLIVLAWAGCGLVPAATRRRPPKTCSMLASRKAPAATGRFNIVGDSLRPVGDVRPETLRPPDDIVPQSDRPVMQPAEQAYAIVLEQAAVSVVRDGSGVRQDGYTNLEHYLDDLVRGDRK